LLRLAGEPLRILGRVESPDANAKPAAPSKDLGRHHIRRHPGSPQPFGKFVRSFLSRKGCSLERKLALRAIVSRRRIASLPFSRLWLRGRGTLGLCLYCRRKSCSNRGSDRSSTRFDSRRSCCRDPIDITPLLQVRRTINQKVKAHSGSQYRDRGNRCNRKSGFRDGSLRCRCHQQRPFAAGVPIRVPGRNRGLPFIGTRVFQAR